MCNQADVYVLSKEKPLDQAAQLENAYDPAALGLDGNIKAVFPNAGDPTKIYLLDTRTDKETGELSYVTLELAESPNAVVAFENFGWEPYVPP